MLKMNRNLNSILKDKLIRVFFILFLIYIGLCTPILRYNGAFLNKMRVFEVTSTTFYNTTSVYEKLPEKLSLDLKYHKLQISRFPKTVIKLIVTDEGKVLGYRYYSAFYPNYFTHKQSKQIIDKEYISNRKKITFHIVKVSYH